MIGGFLAIVSLWLATTKINADFTITGWEFLTNEVDGVDAGDTFKFWRFMPFFAAIAGLGVVVFTALPAAGVNNPTFKILGMIFGILLFVLSLLVIFCTAGKPCFDVDTAGMKFHRQIGAYLTLYGGIRAAGGAFFDWFSSKPKTEKVKPAKDEEPEEEATEEPAKEQTEEAPAETEAPAEEPAEEAEAAEPAEEPEAAEEEPAPAEEERKTAA